MLFVLVMVICLAFLGEVWYNQIAKLELYHFPSPSACPLWISGFSYNFIGSRPVEVL